MKVDVSPEQLRRTRQKLAGNGIATNGAAGHPATNPQPTGPTTLRLDSVTPAPTRWLCRGRIPASDILSLSGEMGQGKSTLLIDLSARVTTGRDWPDGTRGGAPADVLLICAEDRATTVQARFAAADGDLSRCHLLPVVWGEAGAERCLSLPNDLPHVEQAIKDSGAVLLIIDPIEAIVGDIDTHKGSAVRTVTTRLQAIADRTNSTIIYLGHPPKGATNASNAFSSSKAWNNAARAVYVVGPERGVSGEETGRYVLACRKLSAGALPTSLVYRVVSSIEGDPTAPPVIVWEGVSQQTADQTVAPPPVESHRGTSAEERAREAIVEALADGDLGANELERAVRSRGIGRDAYQKARAALRSEKLINDDKSGFQGRVVWRLTTDSQGSSFTGDCETNSFLQSPVTPRILTTPVQEERL